MAGERERAGGTGGAVNRVADDRVAEDAELAAVLAVTAAAGLPISDEDARRLVGARRRIRAMAAEVRGLVVEPTEPSGPAVEPWRVVAG